MKCGIFIRHLENYFNIRKQIVVFDGHCSSWKIILYGVPQGSVLGPLLTLIYINDLPNGLVSICKVFADDTSIFSKVFGKNKSQRNLNNGLFIINEWVFQWKWNSIQIPENKLMKFLFLANMIQMITFLLICSTV